MEDKDRNSSTPDVHAEIKQNRKGLWKKLQSVVRVLITLFGIFVLFVIIGSIIHNNRPAARQRREHLRMREDLIRESGEIQEKAGSKDSKASKTFAPIEFKGTGTKSTELFELARGLYVFETNHSGSSNFIVMVLDSNGDFIALPANEIGTAQTSQAIKIERTGKYIINVTSDGTWNIRIAKP